MKIEYIDGDLLKKAFIVGANTLEKNKEGVNALNVFPVPDGDTGTNMSLTIQSAAKEIKNIDSNNIDDIVKGIAKGSLMGARGNSGVILSQLFRGFSKGLQGKKRLDVKVLAEGFRMASDTAYKAVMKPIEGTILTVARECAEKAMEIYRQEKDIQVFLETVINHGEEALERTPEMLDVLKTAGVVDAGGKGLIYILKGILDGLMGKESAVLEDYSDHSNERDTEPATDIKFGYCTEFIINKAKVDENEFRQKISFYGDSLMVVGGEEIVKVHIHTNNPGEVIEEALKSGELIDIKIDNMRYQHQNKVLDDKEDHINDNDKYGEEYKKYSFISVAMGDGIADVFRELKVDYVIPGGQTMNPSTEDIIKAINEVKGENIIILPNNGNIILAANQAKELSDRNICVLPTKTIPQGVAALLAFESDMDIDENIENMTDAFEHVKTGQVTYAVRDTNIDDKEIKKDDIIGICNGEILSVGDDIENVSMELLKNTIEEDNDLITIFYGNDVSEEEAEKLSQSLEKELEDYDIEVVYGGQPLYYYIFSIE